MDDCCAKDSALLAWALAMLKQRSIESSNYEGVMKVHDHTLQVLLRSIQLNREIPVTVKAALTARISDSYRDAMKVYKQFALPWQEAQKESEVKGKLVDLYA